MISYFNKIRSRGTFRFSSFFVVLAFVFSLIQPAQVYSQSFSGTVLNLPVPGTMMSASPVFVPPLIKGLTLHPENPLQFNFIINTGDMELNEQDFSAEAKKLIKYFLASLTVPEKEMWVNLSPYEKERIIPDGFGVTEMGRDLLAQDYLLKQLTASLIYPEEQLGKKFWDTVHQRVRQQFGTIDIPVNTFNKVWIIPDEAIVWENNGSVFVVESHLKVMLEQDYLSLTQNLNNKSLGTHLPRENVEALSALSSQAVREVIIPELEKEINQGKTFAGLRQIYNSMILAAWYKNNLKATLLGQVYVDQNKVRGIDVEDKEIKQKIYAQYVASFKKGVYNYIKEDYDPASKQLIPKKYFSGGYTAEGLGKKVDSAMLTSSFDQLGSAAQQLIIDRYENNRNVTVLLAENQQEQSSAGAFWRRWRGQTETREFLTALLLDIENNPDPIDFQSPSEGDAEQLKAVTDALLRAYPILGDTIFRGILNRYEQELASSAMTQERLEKILGLQVFIEEIYFAVSPRSALNDSVIPMVVQYENGLASELGDQVVGQMTEPEARESLENVLEQLSFAGDSVFTDDIKLIVVERIYQAGGPTAEFNAERDAVLIDSRISGEVLMSALLPAIRQARIAQIERLMRSDFSDEQTRELAVRLDELAARGDSIAPFLIYFNATEHADFETARTLLQRMVDGEDLLTNNEALAVIIEEENIAREAARLAEGQVAQTARSVAGYIKAHPGVILIPLTILTLGGVAAGAFAQTSPTLPGIPGAAQDGSVVQAPNYHDSYFGAKKVLDLNDRGPIVQDVVSRIGQFTDAQDIADLSGEENPISHKKYDSWLEKNAEKIHQGAVNDAAQGRFTRNVERLVVAFQNEHDLREDGVIGPEVINELRELESALTQSVPSAAAGAPPSGGAGAGGDEVPDDITGSMAPVSPLPTGASTGDISEVPLSTEDLLANLTNPDAQVRAVASEELAARGDVTIIPQIDQIAADTNVSSDIREEALSLAEYLDSKQRVTAEAEVEESIVAQNAADQARQDLQTRSIQEFIDSSPEHTDFVYTLENLESIQQRWKSLLAEVDDTHRPIVEQGIARIDQEIARKKELASQEEVQIARIGFVNDFLARSDAQVDELFGIRDLRELREKYQGYLELANAERRAVIEEGIKKIDEQIARKEALAAANQRALALMENLVAINLGPEADLAAAGAKIAEVRAATADLPGNLKAELEEIAARIEAQIKIEQQNRDAPADADRIDQEQEQPSADQTQAKVAQNFLNQSIQDLTTAYTVQDLGLIQQGLKILVEAEEIPAAPKTQIVLAVAHLEEAIALEKALNLQGQLMDELFAIKIGEETDLAAARAKIAEIRSAAGNLPQDLKEELENVAGQLELRLNTEEQTRVVIATAKAEEDRLTAEQAKQQEALRAAQAKTAELIKAAQGIPVNEGADLEASRSELQRILGEASTLSKDQQAQVNIAVESTTGKITQMELDRKEATEKAAAEFAAQEARANIALDFILLSDEEIDRQYILESSGPAYEKNSLRFKLEQFQRLLEQADEEHRQVFLQAIEKVKRQIARKEAEKKEKARQEKEESPVLPISPVPVKSSVQQPPAAPVMTVIEETPQVTPSPGESEAPAAVETPQEEKRNEGPGLIGKLKQGARAAVSGATGAVDEFRDTRAQKRDFRNKLDDAETPQEAAAVAVPDLDSDKEEAQLRKEQQDRIKELEEQQTKPAPAPSEKKDQRPGVLRVLDRAGDVISRGAERADGILDERAAVRLFRDALEKATTPAEARAVKLPEVNSRRRETGLQNEKAERIIELEKALAQQPLQQPEEVSSQAERPSAPQITVINQQDQPVQSAATVQTDNALDVKTATISDLRDLWERSQQEGSTLKIQVETKEGIVTGQVIEMGKFALFGDWVTPSQYILLIDDATGEHFLIARSSNHLYEVRKRVDLKLKQGLSKAGILRVFIEEETPETPGEEDDAVEPPADEEVGGINLDSTLIKWKIKRNGEGVPLPLPQQPIGEINVDGLFPIIINVEFINLPFVLGMAEEGLPVDTADIPFIPAKSDPLDRVYPVARTES